ncbi:hypothetical protein HYFRA_00000523 [Hymenoscyphus fraxineus]|uniref:Small acidic protein n=1 Tax=Hymenoscyphus fraxineus TaxID=746836 RepID=A0A9N9L400_9HELO|nr:hypothetical protein HYFRA_00000523 [Hymenoscyphus fraxineus]
MNANYIPLGSVDETAYFDRGGEEQPVRHPKIEGKTPEERKEIARAIRLAAKKEKKKIKSDAKKQRKQNAIMHRRLTKNPEKYVKNKERNKLRDIDNERHKIRMEAVRQAERLAAIHDPSGKMFNVGQVIVLEDGRVKNKEIWERAEETRKAKEAGIELPAPNPAEGINPERMPLIKGGIPVANPAAPAKKLSNKQRARLAASLPKPVPPRPILPPGITIPMGEEDFISQFDITDEDIQKRLSKAKGAKKIAAKQLRRVQQEQKKFNKAMKIKKKQAANRGEIWDPIKAKKEVLGEQEAEEAAKEAEEAKKSDDEEGKDSDSSSSGSDSDSDSESESDSEGEEEKAEKSKSNKSKRRAEDDAEGEPQAKKSKKSKSSSDDTEAKKGNGLDFDFVVPPVKKKSKTILHREVPKINLKLIQPEGIDKTLKKHIKQARKDAKRAAEAIEKARKKKIEDEKALEAENARRAELGKPPKRKPKQAVEVPPEEAHLNKKARKFLRDQRKAEEAAKLSGESKEEMEARLEKEEAARKIKKAENKAKKEELDRHVAAIMLEKNGVETRFEEEKAAQKAEKKAKKRGHDQVSAAAIPEKKGLASQWNSDKLGGGAARQDKFNRLLGGKKANVEEKSEERKSKKVKNEVDLEKVQNELERQYESGMKMKYDGGGKRRGLGA